MLITSDIQIVFLPTTQIAGDTLIMQETNSNLYMELIRQLLPKAIHYGKIGVIIEGQKSLI